MELRRIHKEPLSWGGTGGDSTLAGAASFLHRLTKAPGVFIYREGADKKVQPLHGSEAFLEFVQAHEEPLAARLDSLSSTGEAALFQAPDTAGWTWMATPIPSVAGPPAVIGMALALAGNERPEPFFIILQTVAASAALRPEHLLLAPRKKTDPNQTLHPVASALARATGASIAFIATWDRLGLHALGVSGCANWHSKSPLVPLVKGAMRDTSVEESPLWQPIPHQPTSGPASLFLTTLSEKLGAPLFALRLGDGFSGTRTTAILGWTSPTPEPAATSRELWTQSLAFWGSLAASMVLISRSPRALLCEFYEEIVGWCSAHRTAVAWTILGLAILPLPEPILVPCRVEPSLRRVVASPFDAVFKAAKVRPGDTVQEDSLLGELDDKEWRWKQAEAEAALDRMIKLRDRAMTAGDDNPVAIQSYHLEAEEKRLELEQILHKIRNLEIRSPISGTVISGDLDRAAGVPVKAGQSLFELAPLDGLFAEIELEESTLRQVGIGQSVWSRFADAPLSFRVGTITRLHPQTTVRNSKNILLAEASLPASDASAALRPGVKGSALIWTSPRPIAWMILRRLARFFATLGW